MKKNILLLLLSAIFLTSGTFKASESIAKNLTVHDRDLPSKQEAKKIRVGIISSNWNADIVDPLFDSCFDELMELGVSIENTCGGTVPGALELSLAAKRLIAADLCDVCICLGAIIEGECPLWADALAHAVVQNISALSCLSGVPIICGVLICNKQQAHRMVENGIGAAWARSALMMASM